MIQMERLHGISSFHGLTPASSMPSDLIRGSGQAPNPDLYIVVIVRLDPRIKCGAGSESRIGSGFPDQVVE